MSTFSGEPQVAGSLLGMVAVIQYPPQVALAVAVTFLVPPFLHWLAWQRDHGYTRIGVLLVITTVMIGAVGLGAARGYDRFFGPTHPASATPAPDASAVMWIWSGGVTDNQAQVVARLDPGHGQARLLLSTSPEMTDAIASGAQSTGASQHHVIRETFADLDPDTRYHYAVDAGEGPIHAQAGNFRTFPAGPANFKVALGACASTGSNGSVFDAIRGENPLLYLQTGDFHYANIESDSQALFRDALDQSLTSPAQGALYRSTSVTYVWDDHDYAGNDANKDATSRPAAEAVYRQYVPHHSLAGTPDEGPIYQKFTVGRVRFLLTDTRSTRTPQSAPDDADKYMIGPDQERWFLDEVKAASSQDGIVVWVNSLPWIAAEKSGEDSWAGYSTQRARLADQVAALGMNKRIVMLSGDAHMVALDDGTDTNYGATKGAAFPLLQAGALDRIGSVKGGPYSEGTFPGGGQYGLMEVRDDGTDSIRVKLRGKTWDGRTLVDQTFRISTS